MPHSRVVWIKPITEEHSMISPKFLLEVSKRPTYAAMWHRRSISRNYLVNLIKAFFIQISCSAGSEIIERNPEIASYLESAPNADYQISFEELVAFANSK